MTNLEAPQKIPATRERWWIAPLLLVTGVVLVPAALGLAFNSWTGPDAEGIVRMAFASVAGCTIAIVTVVCLFVARVVSRAPKGDIAWAAIIAVVITAWAIAGIGSAADLLIQRFDAYV